MKNSFTNLALFVVIAIAVSVLTNCSGVSSSSNATTANETAQTAVNAAPEKKKTDYPPIAAAVADAEIKNLDGTTWKIAPPPRSIREGSVDGRISPALPG